MKSKKETREKPKCPTCGNGGATEPISGKKEDVGYCYEHFPSEWKPITSHVKIEVVGKGYFLTIKDACFPTLSHEWAVTKEELLELQSLLNDMF